mgnify:CR=1 FL=1
MKNQFLIVWRLTVTITIMYFGYLHWLQAKINNEIIDVLTAIVKVIFRAASL